eukprot:TRINITY_DN1585_c0_g1_i4.p1 TRINITY_DN1585_c0_g1~~TRINITY_DN1585_c0_g1_i4.p1  ORF type:complete len:782 (+),score=107.00 TRINITY_DN1585_c0_g1_i4:75-2420(+)
MDLSHSVRFFKLLVLILLIDGACATRSYTGIVQFFQLEGYYGNSLEGLKCDAVSCNYYPELPTIYKNYTMLWDSNPTTVPNKFVTGKYGKAFAFSNSSTSITKLPEPMQKMSILFWFKTSSPYSPYIDYCRGNPNIFRIGPRDFSSTVFIAIYWAGGTICVGNGGEGYYEAYLAYQRLDDGNWHHIAVVKDYDNTNSAYSYYIDGSLSKQWSRAAATDFNVPVNTTFHIGPYGSFNDTFVVDELVIYNRVLSESEIIRDLQESNTWTSAMITTQPLTTQPLTTQPLTTRELTTKPLTTQELTTKPLTTQELTTKPLTTQPLTTKPLTTQELTTAFLTTQELTTQPLTTQPLTTQELTTAALTTNALTTQELTTSPLTTLPLTTIEVLPPLSTGAESSSESGNGGSRRAAVGAGVGVTMIILTGAAVVAAFIIFRRKRQARKTEMSNIEMIPRSPAPKHSSVHAMNNIELGEILGEGNFGKVYAGEWNGTKVACKQARENSDEFIQESELLSSLRHPNIVNMLGTYKSPDGSFFMVMEFIPAGDLKTHLADLLMKRHQLSEGSFWQIASGCAKGMAYLESMKIAHRDLALRNLLYVILGSGEYQVKISDFGLSRSTSQQKAPNDEGIYNNSEGIYHFSHAAQLPIRWSAPECIFENKATTKSDVWSFGESGELRILTRVVGVTIWESFEYGKLPYGNMAVAEVIKSVSLGERLPQPSNCPDAMWKIILSCWQTNPDQRPSFLNIVRSLDAIGKSSNYVSITQIGTKPNTTTPAQYVPTYNIV